MKAGLLGALEARPLLFGAATGTELLAACPELGAEGARLERLNATAPDRVRDVHAGFLDAGCDAVCTNSFRADEFEPALAAARLAREACERAGGAPRFAIGTLGPGTGLPSREGADRSALTAGYIAPARGLIEGGVDALLLETCRDPLQVECALDALEEAMRETRELPILLSFSVEPDGRTTTGLGPAEMAAAAERASVSLLALNCSYGPASLDRPLRRLAALHAGPLGAWPNAGLPSVGIDGLHHPVGPDELAEWIAARTAELDLRLVGGCCGAGTAHAAACARALG